MSDWRDYDTHIMQGGTTPNNHFHSDQDCPRIKNPERATERSESFVRYHDPEPCTYCHDDVTAGSERVAADGGRPGGDGECPQGCRHPVAGRNTVEYREETEPLDEPDVIEVYGETIVRTERTHRYAECIVCGWGMDL